MGEKVGITFLQIILILCVVGVISYLLRLYHTLKLEKRLAPFAITSKKIDNTSLFDKVEYYIWVLVKNCSKLLSHSTVLTNYSEKYNKYISFEEREKKDGMDYISIKLLLGVFVSLLSFITLLFQNIHLNLMFFLIIFLICFFIPDIYLNIEFYQKRKRIETDLLKAIIIMNNAFESGRNIMQAIEIVKTELDGPIEDEFKKIYLDITYGLSLDVVFNRFYERVKLEDAKYITTSLSLLNKTGGDIIKVFSMIEKSILNKKNLKNELQSLTSASRFVFKMLVFLPIIFILIIYILNPTYFSPLFTNPFGILIVIFTVLLYILYILIIKRILSVEV